VDGARVASCVVIGGGGHAMVLIDALQASTSHTLAITDPDPALAGARVFGVPVVGDDERLPDLARAGTRYFTIGLGSIGNNAPRRRLYQLALACGLEPLTIVHPRAIVSPHATIGPGAQILAAAVVSASAVLGANVVVNTGAIVEHECHVGDHVHISIGATVAGGVAIGAGAHVGAGAVVRQFLSIGEAAIVGAGAVVVKDVPARVVVAGVPAVVLRAVEGGPVPGGASDVR